MTIAINYNNMGFMKERISESPLSGVTETTQEHADLSRLDSMGLEELKTLVRRLACQCGMVAGMTREETAQAMMDELAAYALRPMIGTALKADINARIAAIDKWMDRAEGKPIQKQMIAAKIETSSGDTHKDRLELARKIAFLMADPALTISPMKTIENQ